jgi:hypothetical protein
MIVATGQGVSGVAAALPCRPTRRGTGSGGFGRCSAAREGLEEVMVTAQKRHRFPRQPQWTAAPADKLRNAYIPALSDWRLPSRFCQFPDLLYR